MITTEEAKQIAYSTIFNSDFALTIFQEFDYGWYCSYQSKKFIETNDINYAVAGNPFLIDKRTGQVVYGNSLIRGELLIRLFSRYKDDFKKLKYFLHFEYLNKGNSRETRSSKDLR
jgi:Immunity protein 35